MTRLRVRVRVRVRDRTSRARTQKGRKPETGDTETGDSHRVSIHGGTGNRGQSPGFHPWGNRKSGTVTGFPSMECFGCRQQVTGLPAVPVSRPIFPVLVLLCVSASLRENVLVPGPCSWIVLEGGARTPRIGTQKSASPVSFCGSGFPVGRPIITARTAPNAVVRNGFDVMAQPPDAHPIVA